MDFKQSVADALAGEYDRDAITAEVKAAAEANPLVLFTWVYTLAVDITILVSATSHPIPTKKCMNFVPAFAKAFANCCICCNCSNFRAATCCNTAIFLHVFACMQKSFA